MHVAVKPLMLIGFGLILSACNDQQPSNTTSAAPPAASPAPVQTVQPPAAPSPDDPSVVALVNGTPLTKDVFALFLRQVTQGSPEAMQNPQQQLAALNDLISYTLISQDAMTKGMDRQPVAKAMLELTRTRVLTEAALSEHFKQNPISEEELQQLYAQRFGEAIQEYKARHILLDTEQAAKDVIAELDKGADFIELAKQHSTGPSAPLGGDLGWFESGQMVKAFADAVAALPDGAYSAAPVQTEFGWHVILREQSREGTGPGFDEVRQDLLNQRRQELIAAYVNELKAGAKIELKTPDVTQTPSQDEAHALINK